MTSRRVDYGGAAKAYREARTLPADVLARWRDAVTSLDVDAPRLLDVGAGTGAFLAPVSAWLGAATAVAVEPSAAMRGEAAAAGVAARFPYVAAVAESLPFAVSSFDAAWISAAVHQFDDLDAAARELRRVVHAGGNVLVRGFFADVTVSGVFASFPGIDRAAGAFPATADVAGAFAAAGFAVARVVDVVEPWRFELGSWEHRIESVRSTDSLLRRLTGDEFDLGRRAVIATASADGMVRSDVTLRLVVFEAS